MFATHVTLWIKEPGEWCEGLLEGCQSCDQWAEGMAGALQNERGKSGTWLLTIPLHGFHSVVSTCYHLVGEKFLIKGGGGEAEKQKTKGRERRR